jgi:uncharacterized membrane protein YqiK
MLTESEISIMVQSNQGKADFARAQQQANQIKTLAEAEAERIRIVAEGEAKKVKALAEAEAEKAARVGIAQAMAIEEQVQAYGGPQFQLVQQVMERFASAIEQSKVDVVPKISLGGQGANGNGGMLESLMGVMLSDKLTTMLESSTVKKDTNRDDTLRNQIRENIKNKIQDNNA